MDYFEQKVVAQSVIPAAMVISSDFDPTYIQVQEI